ncbi:MAG: nicotinate-nucleotide adenylyltransferase [Paracoccaceae bacterium]
MRRGLPYLKPGLRVGLLGGSFDPAHEGHVHITLEAMKRFDLDRVIWLVSPGNPLKQKGPVGIGRRLKAAKNLMRHPRVDVSDFETYNGSIFTAETVLSLRRQCPGVRFVWLMGADNLAQFHRWRDWRWIMDSVPVGVLARPGDRISARMSPAARIYAQYRLDDGASHLLGRAKAPAWCFVNVPMVAASSSAIRAQGEWGAGTT